MPKIYVRVNPRSQISKRHRCAIEFTGVWKELDIDAATRAALEEDPYLEVSDSPTVLVEMAATLHPGAIETDLDTNNPVMSEATEGSTGEIAAEGTVTGTASPVIGNEDAHDKNTTDGQSDDASADAEGTDQGAELSTAEAEAGKRPSRAKAGGKKAEAELGN